jgi:hypothetical protein
MENTGKQMAKSTKEQSNPFSTGGGGPNFETRVQAAFTVLLLTGRVSPCLPPWPITRIKLQGTYAGIETDDFIVYAKDPQSGREAKLLAQMKHEVSITEANRPFAAAIQSAWKDFNNDKMFNPETDAIALITGPLTQADISNVRTLLEWARTSENETEFLGKVNTAHFSDDTKRKKLQAFRTQLVNANRGIDLTDTELWQFMKSFYLLGYDLDVGPGSTLSLIQSLIGLYSPDDPSSLWSTILDFVQSADQNAGTITVETLPHAISTPFKTRKTLHWDSDLSKLKAHGEYIVGGIRKSIGGFHVDRSNLLARLINEAERSKFVLVSGPRGCGKSGLIREFTEYMTDRAPVFCLRTEDFDKAHLDSVFSSMGLQSSISELECNLALMPARYLLIESLEKLLELQNSAAFTDLLHFLDKHPGWVVIATTRDYAYQHLVFNYLQPSQTTYSTLLVEDFTDHQIETLCKRVDFLQRIAANPSLKPLLKNPFLAELAHTVTESGAQFSTGDDQNDFRKAVWNHVIAKEQVRADGMPLRRKQTFIQVSVTRARQMVYAVPEKLFDAEALFKLEEDNLIRRDHSAGLVSPAHDVFEDWALEQYIEDAYLQHSDDVVRFVNAVGHEPALTRAFRLWLYEKLVSSNGIAPLVVAILKNRDIQTYWQDETISAVFLGPNPLDFLKQLTTELLAQDAQLLRRFCFILRISCKVPDEDLIRQVLRPGETSSRLNLLLKPHGPGWNAIIQFLFENMRFLPESFSLHLIAVLDEWASLINIARPLPASARQAGLLALHLLNHLKDSSRDDGNRKKMIRIILKVVPAIQSEFMELLDVDVFTTKDERRRLSYVRDLCKVALEDIDSVFLCKHLPDTAVKLALHEWFVDVSKKKGQFWASGTPHIEYSFGLSPYGNKFFPASGRKGPFEHLLRFHHKIGLTFILELLNRAAEAYARSDLDSPDRYSAIPMIQVKSPEQIEIQLDDATSVKQYASDRLWLGYRGHSVLPYVLQSALMALENWLITIAEEPGSPERLESLFDYILRNSNSVMPTAVLASLAIGFPNKLAKAALPLLRTPQLYELDIVRMTQERGANDWNMFAYQRDPFSEIYADERRKASLRPWRREHLENLIQRLQFSDSREHALAVIDHLRAKAPNDDNWRFRFHRIDSRGWTPVHDKENNRIVFQPKKLDSDLEEIQQQTQQQMAQNDRFTRLYLWSEKGVRREATDIQYFSNWNDALTEAKDLLEALKRGDAPNLVGLYLGGIVKAAALFLHDHSDELPEPDMDWCVKVVIEAVRSNANSNDPAQVLGQTDHDGAAAAAFVLPSFMRLAQDEKDKSFLKRLIAVALTHVNPTVRAQAADGVREYLWQTEPEFAQTSVLGAIEYARLEQENLHHRRYALDQDDQQEPREPNPWKEDFLNRIVTGAVSIQVNDIEALGFESYSPSHLLTPCLMIPNGSTEPSHLMLLNANAHTLP